MYKHTFYYLLGKQKYPEIYILQCKNCKKMKCNTEGHFEVWDQTRGVLMFPGLVHLENSWRTKLVFLGSFWHFKSGIPDLIGQTAAIWNYHPPCQGWLKCGVSSERNLWDFFGPYYVNVLRQKVPYVSVSRQNWVIFNCFATKQCWGMLKMPG